MRLILERIMLSIRFLLQRRTYEQHLSEQFQHNEEEERYTKLVHSDI
uniref:Uncharacterized protein n=1 Tax=viral metagenome TaxID=1070528 RepID=A0A6H1ZRE3_9ZZZZ